MRTGVVQTYGANYTLMDMSLTCVFGGWEKGFSAPAYQKGRVSHGRFYQAKRQRGPVSRCDETGPLWGAMRVWRRGVYYDAATGAFPQIKPVKTNLSLNGGF